MIEITTIALMKANNLSDTTPLSAKANLSLDLVENKSASTILSEMTSGNITIALGFTPVTNSRTINGYALSSNVSLSGSDLGLGSVENKSSSTIRSEITSGNITTSLGYTPVTNSRTVNGYPLTTNITLSGSDIGLGSVTNDAQVKRSEMGLSGGVATLGSTGKIPTSQLDPIAITSTYVVGSSGAQIALEAQEGDVCIRTDEKKSYIQNGGTSGGMSNWTWLQTPDSTVLSVFGRAGTVDAQNNDYTWSQINKTTSSISDITTRSAGALDSGNLAVAQMPTGGAWSLSSDLNISGKTTKFGPGAWPTAAIGNSGNRILISDTTEAELILHNANNTIAAGNSAGIVIGARCTANTNDMSFGLITGGKVNATGGDFSSFISFTTQASNGAFAENMRIVGGKVGIGTAVPYEPLSVYGGVEEGGAYYGVARFLDATGYKGIGIGYDTGVTGSGIIAGLGGGPIEFWGYSGAWGNRMTILGDGKVGIGTASPQAQVHVVSGSPVVSITGTGVAATPYMNFFRNSTTLLGTIETGVNAAGNDVGNCLRIFNNIATSGYIYVIAGAASGTGVYLAGGATSWSSNSDERLKENIVPITDASDKVVSLRAVSFNFKSDEKKTSRVGLIAQDVRKVLPQAVDEDADGTLSLRYTEVIPLLVAAHNEQQETINHLKSEISKLKEKQ